MSERARYFSVDVRKHLMAVQNEQEPASGQRLKGKTYYILFWIPTENAGDRSSIHPDHIAYVCGLEADGRLLAAGPFLNEAGSPNGQGMFILRGWPKRSG